MFTANLLSHDIVSLYVNFCASGANFALAIIFFLGVVDLDDLPIPEHLIRFILNKLYLTYSMLILTYCQTYLNGLLFILGYCNCT